MQVPGAANVNRFESTRYTYSSLCGSRSTTSNTSSRRTSRTTSGTSQSHNDVNSEHNDVECVAHALVSWQTRLNSACLCICISARSTWALCIRSRVIL